MLLSPETVKWNVSCFTCIEGKGGGGGEREREREGGGGGGDGSVVCVVQLAKTMHNIHTTDPPTLGGGGLKRINCFGQRRPKCIAPPLPFPLFLSSTVSRWMDND